MARSSTESEYKSLANTAAEFVWLWSLSSELGIACASPTTLWCDNIGAIYLSLNPRFPARTKHIELDYHFLRELVAAGIPQVCFLSTADQVADIMTKPLAHDRFAFLRDKI